MYVDSPVTSLTCNFWNCSLKGCMSVLKRKKKKEGTCTKIQIYIIETQRLHQRCECAALSSLPAFSGNCLIRELANALRRTTFALFLEYFWLLSSIRPWLFKQPSVSTAHAHACLKVDHRSTRDDMRALMLLQSQSKSVGRRDKHGRWDSDGWFERGVITTAAERGAGLPDFQALQHAKGNQEQLGGQIQVLESIGVLKTASALDWFIDRGTRQLMKGTDVSLVWNHCFYLWHAWIGLCY